MLVHNWSLGDTVGVSGEARPGSEAGQSSASGARAYSRAGLPSMMKAVLAPTSAIQSRTALATNSGPLSERTFPGLPRRMKRSYRTSMTSMDGRA